MIRFRARQVERNLEGVLEAVRAACEAGAAVLELSGETHLHNERPQSDQDDQCRHDEQGGDRQPAASWRVDQTIDECCSTP